MSEKFTTAVEKLISKAPATWLSAVCQALRGFPAHVTADFVLQRLPVTLNSDVSYLAAAAVRLAEDKMSWEALGWTLETTSATYLHWEAEHRVELLWAGPSPANQLPARRIDQVLYDLIARAGREILLVTFAATRVERLADALLRAARRGVKIRLVLEFEQSSEGQLSYDAVRAFPPALIAVAEVYQWPIDKRERNQFGRPGKLHAKFAIIDETVLVSSANLTDDAFNRNMEVGVMISEPEFLHLIKAYIDSLIADATLSSMQLLQ